MKPVAAGHPCLHTGTRRHEDEDAAASSARLQAVCPAVYSRHARSATALCFLRGHYLFMISLCHACCTCNCTEQATAACACLQRPRRRRLEVVAGTAVTFEGQLQTELCRRLGLAAFGRGHTLASGHCDAACCMTATAASHAEVSIELLHPTHSSHSSNRTCRAHGGHHPRATGNASTRPAAADTHT